MQTKNQSAKQPAAESQPRPKYKFYATLLDAFIRYENSEQDEALQELLDKINRVATPMSEAACKGSALNNLVDDLLAGDRQPVFDEYLVSYIDTKSPLTASYKFKFNAETVNDLVRMLDGASRQHFTSCIIPTKYGPVEVYGYNDFIKFDEAIDLKFTGSWELGKFQDGMQRHVYPLALHQTDQVELQRFKFLATDGRGIFPEDYKVDLEESEQETRLVCERLIDFLHLMGDKITDRKVFGLEPQDPPQN